MNRAGLGGGVAAMVSVGSGFVIEAVNYVQAKAFQEIMEKALKVIDSDMVTYKIVSNKMSEQGESVPRGDAKLTICQHSYDIRIVAAKFATTSAMEMSRTQQVTRESGASQVCCGMGNSLPVLAAAFGLYKGGVSISEASSDCKLEEVILATTLKELKDDASTVVRRFNAIAVAVGVDRIPIPFS